MSETVADPPMLRSAVTGRRLAALVGTVVVLLSGAPAAQAERFRSCSSGLPSISALQFNAFSYCQEARRVARAWRNARRAGQSTRLVEGFRCAITRVGKKRSVRCLYRGALNDARVRFVFAP